MVTVTLRDSGRSAPPPRSRRSTRCGRLPRSDLPTRFRDAYPHKPALHLNRAFHQARAVSICLIASRASDTSPDSDPACTELDAAVRPRRVPSRCPDRNRQTSERQRRATSHASRHSAPTNQKVSARSPVGYAHAESRHHTEFERRDFRWDSSGRRSRFSNLDRHLHCPRRQHGITEVAMKGFNRVATVLSIALIATIMVVRDFSPLFAVATAAGQAEGTYATATATQSETYGAGAGPITSGSRPMPRPTSLISRASYIAPPRSGRPLATRYGASFTGPTC
jgi:hypothetical protein